MTLKSIIKNPCSWYFLIWLLQAVHEPLKLYGDSISVLILFVLYAWSFYHFCFANVRYGNSQFLRAWNSMYIMFMLYGLYEMINTENHSRLYIIQHCTSMLPIYSFYVYADKGYLTEDLFKKWSLILLPIALVTFFYGQDLAYQLLNRSDVKGVTNNMGYSIAMIIPMFYFWRKKTIVMFLGLTVITLLTLLSLKRGAILVAAVGLLLILCQIIINNKRNKKFVVLAISALFIWGVTYFLQQQLITNDYMLERIVQTINGDSSGRYDIFTDAYKYITTEMTTLESIFGIGANGCFKAIKIEAHNDWIETFMSLGAIGSIIFIWLWISAYQTYRRFCDSDIKFLFGLVMSLLFVRTFFSMSIGDIYVYSTSILGYCLACEYRHRNSLPRKKYWS